jgi:hypothetical protein
MTSKIQSTVDEPKPQPDEANPESKSGLQEDMKKDKQQFMFFSFLCELCGFV